MMDIKEIIKWFLPCFHILLKNNIKMDFRVAFVCLFLLFNFCTAVEANANSDSVPNRTFLENNSLNFSSYDGNKLTNSQIKRNLENEDRSLDGAWSGRTFGRPLKKMMAGLLPIIFSLGAASTWAMVGTLVGIKTLIVTLVILKLLLVAGAAKVGALFGAKASHYKQQEWAPPPLQKEIHLHIHNGQHETHHEHDTGPYPAWSREGVLVPVSAESKNVNIALDQAYSAGPQTISTPYGNYVKVEPARVRKKRNYVTSR